MIARISALEHESPVHPRLRNGDVADRGRLHGAGIVLEDHEIGELAWLEAAQLVLFVLGFVLDFLEIIYIVIPIVGPVIYGGTFDPKWVTIMIAVNLQTSFLTPPFGFALFYLRGVAPPSVTTGHIYRGVLPFVLIQVIGLLLLYTFPGIVTIPVA